MYKRILIPLDGSNTAERVLPVVEKLLRREGSTAVLLRVLHFPVSDSYHYAAVREGLHKVCENYLGMVAIDMKRKEIPVETHVVEGDPADAILSVAAGERCDLIAMSTHGKTGLRRFFLGSVAEKVLRNSSVPVLAVRAEREPKPLPPKPFKNILVPVDGSPQSEKVLAPAIDLAKLYGSKITLLRIVEPVELETPASLVKEWEEKAAAELAKTAEKIKAGGVDGLAYVRNGHAADEILRFAEENSVDLLCMTTHGRGGIPRWVMGSVAERVLRHAPCPVFLVRR